MLLKAHKTELVVLILLEIYTYLSVIVLIYVESEVKSDTLVETVFFQNFDYLNHYNTLSSIFSLYF